ncbi:hypothetical protein ACOTI2_08170 [Achromobacter xylosoxidans]|uniref:hypothetical protein n=1 Tax=Alcaligenes xylosoxydans xylosoxydans TaxID=85698 RepID=UPI003BA425D2
MKPSDNEIEMLAAGFAIQHKNGLIRFAHALLEKYASARASTVAGEAQPVAVTDHQGDVHWRHGRKAGIALYAAPQASAEDVRNAALVSQRQEWANRGDGYGHWVDVDEARFAVLAPECRRTLYLPQADKDGGQLRAGDDDLLRFAWKAIRAELDPQWECNSYHPMLYAAEERLRAALSATQGAF